MLRRCCLPLLLLACQPDTGAATDAEPASTTEVDDASTTAAPPTTEPDEPGSESGSTEPGTDTGVEEPPAVDYVVLAADSLADAAKGFADYRASAGHEVALLKMSEVLADGGDPVEAIRARVRGYRELLAPERPLFLLLVGTAAPGGPVDADTVPLGNYIEMLPSAPEPRDVATDHLYADLDGDDMPEVAVGRLPVGSAAAVDEILLKVVRHEAEYAAGRWNRRINMFASSYDQGELVDNLVEMLVNKVLDEISQDFDITMTYAHQSSPYAYVPQQFSDQVVSRIEEGALMVTYIGHGSATSFPPFVWSGVPYPLLDVDALAALDIRHRSPILTLVACAMGSFAAGESVSAALVGAPGGPVAVLSSTENSDTYPNTIFIRELGQVVTGERPATLGEAFVRAKTRVLTQADSLRHQLDNVFGLVVSDADLEALRRSHLYMYTLFGDPALTVRYPAPATVRVSPETVAPGQVLAVEVEAPALAQADAYLTLESARSEISGELVPVPADDDPGRDAAIVANYTTANDKTLVRVELPLVDGALATEIAVPLGLAPGRYHVKVFADDGTVDAFGSASIAVQK